MKCDRCEKEDRPLVKCLIGLGDNIKKHIICEECDSLLFKVATEMRKRALQREKHNERSTTNDTSIWKRIVKFFRRPH